MKVEGTGWPSAGLPGCAAYGAGPRRKHSENLYEISRQMHIVSYCESIWHDAAIL